jgi:hypothetical protein
MVVFWMTTVFASADAVKPNPEAPAIDEIASKAPMANVRANKPRLTIGFPSP